MATAATGDTLRQIDRIFGAGTVAGLSDRQLLERFTAARDEEAFSALVERHGPMVRATCRVILKDEHAAEDAFQATFLTLARKAPSRWARGTLGGWLYRVAYRNAVRASVGAERRHGREREAMALAAARSQGGTSAWGGDWLTVLHEEIDRLPERQRVPIVLCYLQELTYEQAARELGWTVPTLRCRLAKARERLRSRLSRRGMSTTGASAALATWLDAHPASAGVPHALANAAVRAAMEAAPASLQAVALTARMLMVLTLGAVISIGIFAWNQGRPDPDRPAVNPQADPRRSARASALAAAAGEPEREKLSEAAPPPSVARVVAPPEVEPGATVAVRGRVVDPDDRPVERATVRFFDPWEHGGGVAPTARSRSGGRFDLRVPRSAFDDYTPGIGKIRTRVVATAEGFGFAWSEIAQGPDGAPEVTVRLVADEVPIEGRLVDLEGRPLAGVLVKSRDVWFSREGDLSGWIKQMQMGVSRGHWQGLDYVPLEIAATTGPDGRFTLAGIGRERVAALLVTGPGVESAELDVMTRNGQEVRVPRNNRRPGEIDYLSARFVHALAAGRVIEGVARDQDTGVPLAGVEISGAVYAQGSHIPQPGVQATTDANGRYRLGGLSPGRAYRLFAKPRAGSPYPNAAFRVPAAAPGLAPVVFDCALKQGVLIQGRVTDGTTGKPVRGYVQTYAFNDNPLLKIFPGYQESDAPLARLDSDGRFAIAALPGRGLLAARSDIFRYLGARGFEKIKGLKRDQTSFATSPHNCNVGDFHAIVEINPDGESMSLAMELKVDPGRSLSGTVVDPDGRPIGGTKGAGLWDLYGLWFEPLTSPGFEVCGLDASKPRRLFFVHEGRQLAGSLLVRGDEAGPLIVRLEPWGVVTGRVVDDDGGPRSKLELLGNVDFDKNDPERGLRPGPARVVVDRDGLFRIDELVPGLKYEAWASDGLMLLGTVYEGVQVGPGETRHLGDVKVIARPND